jgi:Uma2 family endonuclease
VICGPLERDPDDTNTVTNPTIIVEILSDSTEVYDRNEKFSNYRRIPSLRSYVLVSQHEARVEVYQRGADGRWTLDEARAPEAARIDALDCSLPVSAVYSGVFA